jgi:hypothetical protein
MNFHNSIPPLTAKTLKQTPALLPPFFRKPKGEDDHLFNPGIRRYLSIFLLKYCVFTKKFVRYLQVLGF